jgi:tRNA(Leu) C34 or U34 (ribose-2'-O)-methylase TrmL
MSASILLSSPKHARNVGAVLRDLACFGGEELFFTGDRIEIDGLKRLPREERMKAYSSTPWTQLNDPVSKTRPIDKIQTKRALRRKEPLTPVAIELVPGSQMLPYFEHPENALYVFGPEDGHIPDGLRRTCHAFVTIPSLHCFNLSVAAALVLYDRMTKRVAAGLEEFPSVEGEARGWWHETALEAIG